MQHLEPEDIALAALGEELTAGARDHLETCPVCADELAALSEAVDAGRAAGPDALVAPPPQVWERVRAELGLDVGEAAPEPSLDAAPTPAPEAAPSPATPAIAEPTPLTSRARDRHLARWLAVAAAGGLVLGAGGATWWAGRPPATTIVEQAALEALPGWTGAAGTAVVEESADGTRTLVVDVSGADPGDGVREVWLIDTEVTRLISLGLLTGTSGSFVLPDGVDLTEFPVVDVSEEPLDGDPAHSGDSVVRGVLGT